MYFQFLFKDDALLVNHLLTAIGRSEGEVQEYLMDVVTALSGSGPAYVKINFLDFFFK
jgi:pyrroline-5-carboxylate reductase